MTSTAARGPLLVALILRLALPFAVIHVFGSNDERDWARFFTPDTYSYLIPAQNLLEHGAFFLDASTPEIFRTPGYPLLLAIGLMVRSPIIVALVFQAFAGTLIVWCTMRTASHLSHDNRAVRTCGWLAACEPLALLYGSLLIADTLLAAAISVAVLLLVQHFQQPSTRSAIALGLALAAAAYIKPIAYYLPAIIIPWLWFERHYPSPQPGPPTRGVGALGWRPSPRKTPPQRAQTARRGPRRGEGVRSLSPSRGEGRVRGLRSNIERPRLSRDLAVIAATFALLCGAWQVRNGMLTGFWGFSTLTARAVYVAAGGGVTAARDGRPFGDVRQERLEEAAIRTPREPLHIGDMYRRGVSDVLAAPATALAVHVKGMLLTLFDPGSLDYLRLFGAYPATSPATRYGSQGLAATVATIVREYPAVLWCSLVLEAILLGYLALAARGAWRALRRGVPEARALLLITAYFLLLSGGIFGTARFRLPIMSMMILLGGYGLFGAPRRPESDPRWVY